MGIFQNYAALRNIGIQTPENDQRAGIVTTPQPQQPTQPVVDPDNAIGSLAELLGPTPAEREAIERRRLENKSKMQMWGGFFEGLRQLGNLYYTAKGATPQQYTDNPSAQIGQMADTIAQREDAVTNYSRQYAAQLYNLQRQLNEDRRKDMLTAAQAKYYDTRDEVARMKAENDRLKNEKYVQLMDGRIAKVNAETGQIEKLLPYKQQEIQSRTAKNNRTGGTGNGRSNGTYGYRTTKHIDPATGDVITERVPTTGGEPEKRVQKRQKSTNSSGSGSNRSGFFNK